MAAAISSHGFAPTTRSAGRLRFPPTTPARHFLSYNTPNPTLPPSHPSISSHDAQSRPSAIPSYSTRQALPILQHAEPHPPSFPPSISSQGLHPTTRSAGRLPVPSYSTRQAPPVLQHAEPYPPSYPPSIFSHSFPPTTRSAGRVPVPSYSTR